MEFTGLLPVSKTRPSSPGNTTTIIRDTLSLPTWLSIGAALQTLAFLLLGRIAFLPATCLLIYRVLEAYAIATGLTPNPHMKDVIMGKYSTVFPDSEGRYGSKAGQSDVAVLLIGTQSNHPLGLLAPGFKELGAHMSKMIQELETNAPTHNFLSSNTYISTTRSTNNSLLNIMYFQHSSAVHAFATGPLHRDALDWWNRVVKTYPHLSIYHELYHVSRGQWESVYAQCKPLGVAATVHYAGNGVGAENGVNAGADGGEEGKKGVWMSPVVDARKGVLRSSAGRMGKGGVSE